MLDRLYGRDNPDRVQFFLKTEHILEDCLSILTEQILQDTPLKPILVQKIAHLLLLIGSFNDPLYQAVLRRHLVYHSNTHLGAKLAHLFAAREEAMFNHEYAPQVVNNAEICMGCI